MNLLLLVTFSCSGENSNNTSRLDFFSGRVIDPNTGGPTNGCYIPLSVNDVVTGSEEIESVSSIRKYAPVFSTQYRAVTAADFESLIPTIYPDAESVSVFGGEELILLNMERFSLV